MSNAGQEAGKQHSPPDRFVCRALSIASQTQSNLHQIRSLCREDPAKLVSISARVGSITDNSLGGWYSYRASKTALNQLTKCMSVEFARRKQNIATLLLHPGTVDTDLSKPFQKVRYHDLVFRLASRTTYLHHDDTPIRPVHQVVADVLSVDLIQQCMRLSFKT